MARYRRWVAVADNHGDACDPSAVEAALDFCKWWRPEFRIHLGDAFDFRPFRGKASEQERRERMQTDIDAGIDFLKRFRPTTFLRGNHDERLWKQLKSDDGKVAEYAQLVIREIEPALKGAAMYPWDRRLGVARLGDQALIHGFYAGVNAARQSAQVYGNVLVGHAHAIDQCTLPGLEPRTGRTIGCLCRLDMEYDAGNAGSLRHRHGWAYGLMDARGRTIVWQAEKLGDSWLFPSEFREARTARRDHTGR